MDKIILMIGALAIVFIAFAQGPDNEVHKGNEYYGDAAYDLAVLHYQQAINKNSENYGAHYNLANTRFRQKKYAEASEHYKRAAEIGKGFQKAAAYYNEGVVHSNMKNPEAAIESYKKTLRINPDDKQARENLQKALSELKKQQQQKQKQQEQQKKSTSKMSQKEAEQKLKQLQEKEEKLQQRLQKGAKGEAQPKDW